MQCFVSQQQSLPSTGFLDSSVQLKKPVPLWYECADTAVHNDNDPSSLYYSSCTHFHLPWYNPNGWLGSKHHVTILHVLNSHRHFTQNAFKEAKAIIKAYWLLCTGLLVALRCRRAPSPLVRIPPPSLLRPWGRSSATASSTVQTRPTRKTRIPTLTLPKITPNSRSVVEALLSQSAHACMQIIVCTVQSLHMHADHCVYTTKSAHACMQIIVCTLQSLHMHADHCVYSTKSAHACRSLCVQYKVCVCMQVIVCTVQSLHMHAGHCVYSTKSAHACMQIVVCTVQSLHMHACRSLCVQYKNNLCQCYY